MTDAGCRDTARFAGDVDLAPSQLQPALAAHLATCTDCATYASQMATTRELLRRHGERSGTTTGLDGGPAVHDSSGVAAAAGSSAAVRGELLALAELVDPVNAEDLTQQSLEVGLALERRDTHRRTVAELAVILNALSDAQARLDGRTVIETDLTAAARTRASSLEELDSDADEPELYYPDLYPDTDGLEEWPASPEQWPSSGSILGPEEDTETGEAFDTIDRALAELPEPLGELLTLVDLQGFALAGSAEALGLTPVSATAALARARNHVRGRLNRYLTGRTADGALGR